MARSAQIPADPRAMRRRRRMKKEVAQIIRSSDEASHRKRRRPRESSSAFSTGAAEAHRSMAKIRGNRRSSRMGARSTPKRLAGRVRRGERRRRRGFVGRLLRYRLAVLQAVVLVCCIGTAGWLAAEKIRVKPLPPQAPLMVALGVPRDSVLESVLMSREFRAGVGGVVFLVVYICAMMYMVNNMGGRRKAGKVYRPDGSMPCFDDIAGQDQAKEEVMEVVEAMRDPQRFRKMGANVPKGILLVGPPGTGKTLMARAIAGESKCSFISTGGSAFDEMFVGVGAARVRKLFELARKNSPCVLFIDEIDSLAPKRSGIFGASGRQQTVNQLLAELDGFEKNRGLVTIAATNMASLLDPALLRPGRLDRQIHMGLPDQKGRLDILRVHTSKKPLGPDVRLDLIAKTTVQFSGADLANVCNEAAIRAAKEKRSVIGQEHFSYALERIVLGIERPPLTDELDQQTVAYHESGHALVALLVPGAKKPVKITMVPRGPALGVTWLMPLKDSMLHSKTALLCEIETLLGGRAAEELVFGEVTTGAADDLSKATELASRIVKEFGMDKQYGLVHHRENPQGGYRRSSEKTTHKLEIQVDKIVNSSYKKVLSLLKENRHTLNKMAKALLKKQVLEAAEIEEVTGIKIQEEDLNKGVLDYVK